jgi:hypothetical protein
MRTFVKFAFAVGLLALSPLALPFGNEGHKTVGDLAAKLIKGKRAETEVAAILAPDELLSRAATWPDRAKDKNSADPEIRAYNRRNRSHHDYHYTNVPFASTEYAVGSVGAKPIDIVATMQQCIAVLQGKTDSASNPHRFRKREALRLLVHLVGDIHQPLHVGNAYINDDNAFFVPARVAEVDNDTGFATKGGNNLLVGDTSLHSYWDNDAVANARDKLGATSSSAFASKLFGAGLTPIPGAGSVDSWPKQWADEALEVSKDAFRGVSVDHRIDSDDSDSYSAVKWAMTIPANYDDVAAEITKRQITLAGQRLAAVLVDIWPET